MSGRANEQGQRCEGCQGCDHAPEEGPRNLTETEHEFIEYRKITTIQACRIFTPFIVETLEGVFLGKAGDWLVCGIEGERYIIDNGIFNSTYMEVE